MSVFLFIIVLTASFIVVRIGAIAFHLTGLEWSLAKFQALSCFSGTGFTTREAELITTHKERRRIASILMVLGNAGLVTLIATVASALNPQKALITTFSESFLPFRIPLELIPWANLLIIILAVYLLLRLFRNKRFAGSLTNFLREKIVKKDIFKTASFEEILQLAGGYGVSRIDVCRTSPLVGRTLRKSGLREQDITVLAIIRGEQVIANPSAGTQIREGDGLVSFGVADNIRANACEAGVFAEESDR